MSTAQFTCPLIVTIPGQLITSSLWNNEFTSLFTNLNPVGVGGYSDTDPQMQIQTDPYPGGATSRPSAVSGEIERIRYLLNLITGNTYWYQHPTTDLTTVKAALFPSGTRMFFQQASVPTGWTRDSSLNGHTLRVTSGVPGSRTSKDISSTITLGHSHTVNSHTHDITHTHTMGNHTHTSAAHTHTVPRDGWGSLTQSFPPAGRIATAQNATSQQAATGDNTSGSTTPGVTGGPSTNTTDGPSSTNSGATSPATDSQLTDVLFSYLDVIIGVKN